MINLTEIQEAIRELNPKEKQALSIWLTSEMASIADLDEEERLLRSIDAACRELDTGKGVPLPEVRKLISEWAGK